MNILLMFVSCVIIAITGFIIWFPAVFPAWLVRWSYRHTLALCYLAAVFDAFLFRSASPDSNQALKGVITGWVPAKFGRATHEMV